MPKDELSSPEYITIHQQIMESNKFDSDVTIKSVKIEQSPKADTYVIKVVDTNKVESTVTAFKNPTTQ